MRAIRWLLIGLGVLFFIVGIGVSIAWIATGPGEIPKGSQSEARLAPGLHSVGRAELEWVDHARPTPANGDFPGSSERRFPVALWYPEHVGGQHPLLVYSHGFMSGRHGCTYMAEHMASHGYVVVSADFPLSNIKAPGGPNYLDVVNQPADVSFLIDRVLALDEPERPFEGTIDPERIGAFGISLGGITTTLVAFHPEWRDPRVAAALSIAGPGDVFGPRFFEHADVPFLMIAGTSDAIVDYEANAAPIPDRVCDGGLVSIAGGTHAGFTHLTAGLLRLLGNPDKLGCAAAAAAAESADTSEQPPTWFAVLAGTPEQGLLEPAEVVHPCSRSFEIAMRAPRQHLLTMLAVRAFFGSRIDEDSEVREEHETFLKRTFPAELAEIIYTPSRRREIDEG